MKRRLVLLLLLLLGGAIVNVAVAWGCVMVLAELKNGWSMRSAEEQLPSGEVWAVWRLDRPGYLQIDSYFTTPPVDPRHERSPSVIETWSRIPDTQDFGTQWSESASGWPYTCLWLRLTVRDPGHSIAGVASGVLPGDIVEHGLPVSRFILPLRPIWGGFAINTVFYAVGLWLLFAGPFVLRRRRRIRRGLCPKCAYDLRGTPRGADATACPECGAAVSRAPSSGCEPRRPC